MLLKDILSKLILYTLVIIWYFNYVRIICYNKLCKLIFQILIFRYYYEGNVSSSKLSSEEIIKEEKCLTIKKSGKEVFQIDIELYKKEVIEGNNENESTHTMFQIGVKNFSHSSLSYFP